MRRLSRPAHRFRFVAVTLLAVSAPLLQGNISRTDNIAERMIAAHNRERAALGIAPLVWDEGLARDAAKWADHLTQVGHLVHSPDKPDDPDPQGENLWAGTSDHFDVETMVGLWAAEKANFKQGVFPANSTTGELEDVGHYTQLIWRSTRKVGCALARGETDEFLVCRYAEGGNVIGERPF